MTGVRLRVLRPHPNERDMVIIFAKKGMLTKPSDLMHPVTFMGYATEGDGALFLYDEQGLPIVGKTVERGDFLLRDDGQGIYVKT